MTTPVILNALYDSQGMRSFVYIMLFSSSLELIMYGLLQTYASCTYKGVRENKDHSREKVAEEKEKLIQGRDVSNYPKEH